MPNAFTDTIACRVLVYITGLFSPKILSCITLISLFLRLRQIFVEVLRLGKH